MTRDLIDPDDGENRAVRMFLALYGCTPGCDIGQMRRHLTMSGFPHWPAWAETEPQTAHLTKGGAQSWLRHLFALEAAAPPLTVGDELSEAQIEKAWRLGFRHACDAERLNSDEEWGYKGANVIEAVQAIAAQPAAQAEPLTDEQIVSYLEAAGVEFQRFMGGVAGTKDCWSTAGSQSVKKIAAGVRAALASNPPAQGSAPITGRNNLPGGPTTS